MADESMEPSSKRARTARSRNKMGWKLSKQLSMPGLSNRNHIFGFPDTLYTKLRYFEEIRIDVSSGALNTYLFRTNSIYDPNYTGTGHQPLYRDELAAIYDHYSVVASKIKVRFVNSSSSPFNVYLGIDDDTSATVTSYTLAEQNHTKGDALTPLTGSKSYTVLKSYWGSKAILATDPNLDSGTKTPMGSDPTEESFFVIGANTPDGTTNTIRGTIEIIYSVQLSELRTPTQS